MVANDYHMSLLTKSFDFEGLAYRGIMRYFHGKAGVAGSNLLAFISS